MTQDFFPAIFDRTEDDTERIISAAQQVFDHIHSTYEIISYSTEIILRIETKELDPSYQKVKTVSERHLPRKKISPEILTEKAVRKSIYQIKAAIKEYCSQISKECKLGLNIYQRLKEENPKQVNNEANYAVILKDIIERAEKIRELIKDTIHSIAEKTETAKEELEDVLQTALKKLRDFNIAKETCVKLIEEGEQSTSPKRVAEILKELEPLQQRMIEEILQMGYSFHISMARYSPGKMNNLEHQHKKLENVEEIYIKLKKEIETALEFIQEHPTQFIDRKRIEQSMLNLHLLLTEKENEYPNDQEKLAQLRRKQICDTINKGNKIIKARCKAKEVKNSFPPTKKYVITLKAGMLRRKLGTPLVILEKREGDWNNNFYTYLDPSTINAIAKALTANEEEAIEWVKNALEDSARYYSYACHVIIKIKKIAKEDLE